MPDARGNRIGERSKSAILRMFGLFGRLRASLVASGELVRDIVGLLDFLDLANLAGKSLLRVNVKAITLALLVSLGINRIARAVVDRDALSEEAVKSFTVAYAAIAVVGGILLVLTSVLVRGSRIAAAQAYHLNLTEVRKRNELGFLVRGLWTEAYQEEARLLLPLAERRRRERMVRALLDNVRALPWCGVELCPGSPPGGATMDARTASAFRAIRDGGLHLTRVGFEFVAENVLSHPIPPHLYSIWSGLDFARVADYFDGGYFDVSDDRLAHQIAASPVLARAKLDVRLPLGVKLRYGVGAGIRRLWFVLVTRAFAIQIAKQVDALNARVARQSGAPSSYFNALHLFWPTFESEEDIEIRFSKDVLIAVRAARQALVRRVFGRERAGAFRGVDRMFVPNFLFVYELRKRCDPDFIDRLVRTNFAELGFLRLSPARLDAERDDLIARKGALDAFVAVLPQLGLDPAACSAEGLRTLRYAFLTDTAGVQLQARAVAASTPGARNGLARACREALAAREMATRTLRELRIHHLLCREQIVNYRRQLAELLGDTGIDGGLALASKETSA
jgi:hypothetical protein